MVQGLRSEFVGMYCDNEYEITQKLNELDQYYDSDKGESIMEIKDALRLYCYFDSPAKLKQAYKNIVRGIHKDMIIKVKPEMNSFLSGETLRIVFYMGIDPRERRFLPIPGEVQLIYGKPTAADIQMHIL